jgi:hypothetical protein
VDQQRLDQHIAELRERPAADATQQAANATLLSAYTQLRSRLAGRRQFPTREGERRRASVEAMGLQTSLTNCRQVTISISQLFRIDDFLTQPSQVRAKNLPGTMNEVAKLRRTLNPNGAIAVDGLGSLEPVARIGQSRDRDPFWSMAIPDLREPEAAREPPLVMLPFELSPFPRVESLKLDPELWVEDLVKDTLGPATQHVKVESIRGSLRIYPTGIGIVRLATELEFAGPILVELIGNVARKIEDTVFVDAEGASKRVESFLAELVNFVAASVFEDAGEHDRRWRPPETIIRLRQGAFLPEDHTRELAYAMSLSPGRESLASLRSRIEKKLRSKQWIDDGVLAVPGHRVLLLVRSIDPQHKGPAAARLLKSLAETHELTTVALHTYRVFGDDLAQRHDEGWPNDQWLPGTENFSRLVLLVETIRRAVRAVGTVPRHLERTGKGVLTAIAREVWDADAQPVIEQLNDGLLHIGRWIAASGYAGDAEMVKLAGAIAEITSARKPFAIRAASAGATTTEEEELMENDILDGLQRMEELLAGDALQFDALDGEILRVEDARRRLFASLD